MSKICLIIGSNSDIAKGLIPLLKADGYEFRFWRRYGDRKSNGYRKCKIAWQWDLCIVAIGSVAPVGLWHEVDSLAWEQSISANLITPIRVLRHYWPRHKPGATVCFLAGSNPNMIMDGYSAYNAGKMGLLKAVEQMDHETPDAKFVALAPGTILTKIHDATIQAQWKNPKLEMAIRMPKKPVDQIQKVYDCLRWCIAQDKKVIGGRNICVSDPWQAGITRDKLQRSEEHYKLRRVE